MANEFNVAQAGTLSPEDYAQQQALNRQQRYADMLMQQNQQPQGQMISGRYVAPSWAQQLQAPVNMLLGAYLGKQNDTEAGKLAEKIRQAKGAKEEAITNLITGAPEKTTELAGPYTGNVPMPTAYQAPVKQDLAAALREINTNNPYGAGSEFKSALVGNMIPKTSEKVSDYNFAKTPEGGGFKGTFNEFNNQLTPYQAAELDLRRKQLALETNGGKLTESQAKASVYHNQMTSASGELNNVYQSGFNPNSTLNQAETGAAGGLFNFATSSDAQRAKQAQNQWSEAYLRFKTGAGTNAHEIEANRKTYFPQVVDDAATIAQKARMRAQAENDIAIASGPAARLQNPSVVPPANTKSNAPVSNAPLQFSSEADAAKAGLPNGTPVVINGVSGTWKH